MVLKADVDELEALRELADELEESHNETEKQLQEEIGSRVPALPHARNRSADSTGVQTARTFTCRSCGAAPIPSRRVAPTTRGPLGNSASSSSACRGVSSRSRSRERQACAPSLTPCVACTITATSSSSASTRRRKPPSPSRSRASRRPCSTSTSSYSRRCSSRKSRRSTSNCASWRRNRPPSIFPSSRCVCSSDAGVQRHPHR